MLNQKELETSQIILKLWRELKDIGIGLPLQTLYREIKRVGIYQSNYFIMEKIKRFESMGFIKIENWNIVDLNEKLIETEILKNSETSQ